MCSRLFTIICVSVTYVQNKFLDSNFNQAVIDKISNFHEVAPNFTYSRKLQSLKYNWNFLLDQLFPQNNFRAGTCKEYIFFIFACCEPLTNNSYCKTIYVSKDKQGKVITAWYWCHLRKSEIGLWEYILIRDAPLDFKGGGAGSLGQDKFFFSSSLARKVFLFSVPNGASFFFFFFFF